MAKLCLLVTVYAQVVGLIGMSRLHVVEKFSKSYRKVIEKVIKISKQNQL